jgi:acetyl-CoA acetyltransferase
MRSAVIVDIVRTASGKGKPGGAVSGCHPADLLGTVIRALVDRTGLDPGPGRFNVVGTVVAIFFVATSVSGLTLAGIDPWIQDVFNGCALVLGVSLAAITSRRRRGGEPA